MANNDQPKPAVATDLMNSDELRRAVSALVEDEIKKLQQTHDKDEGTFLRKFAGEVTVTGLSDAIKAKHKIIRFLWLVIFFGGLAATAFFVYRVFEEYKHEPTATKVNIMRESSYEFPPIVLCPDTWVYTEKAMKMGLSKEGLQFGLKYLIPFEDVVMEYEGHSELSLGSMNETIYPTKPAKSKPKGIREEFFKVYHRHNFTSVVDFFKYISVDAVVDSEVETEIGFKCIGCIVTDRLEKVVIDKSVCYSFLLNPVDGKLRQSYGLPEYELRVPDLSKGLQSRRAYWKLYVNPMTKQLMSDTPYISIYEQQSHSVRIMTESFHMASHEPNPCIQKNDPKYPNYSTMSCVIGCAARFYQRIYGCSVLNLDLNHSKPVDHYCNTYYWDKWPIREDVDTKKLERYMLACVNRCREECSFTWYTTSVDAHLSNSLVKDALAWNKNTSADGIRMRSAKLYFINLDVLAGGVVTFTEVSTYSFQTLVGNIGGTCGIWIGVSVMTLIQLCMFFVERSLETNCGNEQQQVIGPSSKQSKKSKQIKGKNKAEQTALV